MLLSQPLKIASMASKDKVEKCLLVANICTATSCIYFISFCDSTLDIKLKKYFFVKRVIRACNTHHVIECLDNYKTS